MIDTNFIGSDLDGEACEVLMNTRWPSKFALGEADLFGSKWWDYRFEHPVISTYRFAHVFGEKTREFIRKHIDDTPPRLSASGKLVQWEPIKSGDIFEPPATSRQAYWKQKISATIKARHFADTAGIPYEFYIHHGLKHWFFGRNYFLEHTKLPSPMLLNNLDCIAKILDAWEDYLGAKIHHGEHPAYVFSADFNPFRDAHEQFILDQISKKADPKFALRKFLGAGLITRASAVKRFGNSVPNGDVVN